jgi:hypothetical protein
MLKISENQESYASLITYVVVKFDPQKKNENTQFSESDSQDKEYRCYLDHHEFLFFNITQTLFLESISLRKVC